MTTPQENCEAITEPKQMHASGFFIGDIVEDSGQCFIIESLTERKVTVNPIKKIKNNTYYSIINKANSHKINLNQVRLSLDTIKVMHNNAFVQKSLNKSSDSFTIDTIKEHNKQKIIWRAHVAVTDLLTSSKNKKSFFIEKTPLDNSLGKS